MEKTPPTAHPPAATKAPLLYWPDRLRNLATVMVITIHVAAPVAHSGGDLNSAWWWYGNFWNSLSRAGVPLFVMLSGFLLLSKDYELGDFLKRRFSRVVVPALFWMAVYSIYNHIRLGAPATLQDALLGVVTGPVHIHLWFIYLIIGLYLIYPILRPWVRSASERDFLYFFIMCALCTWGMKIAWTFFGVGNGIYFELFTNNCGYFVLGYYLGTRSLKFEVRSLKFRTRQPELQTSNFKLRTSNSELQTPNFKLPTLFLLLGTLATMFGSYWLNVGRADVPFQTYFYDYLTPNVGVAAIGWFLLAKNAFNSRPLLDVERDFSAASFGIYFAHIGVMDWWSQCNYWHSRYHTFAWLSSLIGLVTGLSFLAVAFIRALPGGKKVT
jgi:surface polysaccharide O-acyltransferase-like enzyme